MPHSPWQNGEVEGLTPALVTECAYRHVFTSLDERRLCSLVHHYKTRHRHSALGDPDPPPADLMGGYA